MRIKPHQIKSVEGTGTPQPAIIKSIWVVPDTEDLFWLKVNKNGPLVKPELGNCWVWTNATDSDGYGVFAVKRKLTGAHRFGYIIQNGDIPEGHFVMHKCDNPPCVRGSHLGTGTNAENLGDMAEKGRARGGRRTKDGQEPKNRRQSGDDNLAVQAAPG